MPNKKAAVLHGEIRELVRQYARELALDGIYPIGSIYISVNNVNPSSFLGGKWELIQDDTFIASKGLKNAGQIGGSNNAAIINHIHTIDGGSHRHNLWSHNGYASNCSGIGDSNTGPNLGIGCADNNATYNWYDKTPSNRGNHQVVSDTSHTHNCSNPTGGESATNKNMPKYLACYIFKRIA